jgi:CRP/FNR family transcriptional regulator
VGSDIQGIPPVYRDIFAHAAFWSAASEAAIERLAHASSVHECKRGEVLFREGSMAVRGLVVLAGYVRAVHYQTNGHSVLIESSAPGEVIGPIGGFADVAFEADIEAGSDTVVAFFPMSLLKELVATEPGVALSVIQGLAKRWVSVISLTKRNAAEVPTRLARYLLELPALRETDTTRLVELPGSRVELAVILATSPETLSRTFHVLTEEGVVDAYMRTVRILDLRALERLAQDDPSEQ